jgi:hypothetical protein
MIFDYLTHYYNTVPFRSLSALSKSEALRVMEDLCDDSPFFERFKEPIAYWDNRLETENWLRDSFIQKGGKPKVKYPLYAVLGSAAWIENYSFSAGFAVDKVQIPVSIFNENEISFTFPDSMVSFWIARDKPDAFYNPRYHGHTFTLSEIKSLITNDLMNNIESMHPQGTIPYVEAQIWNHEIVKKFYYETNDSGK